MVTSALADIKDVVSWIESIEQFVGRLYASAAKAFADDKHFSKFLRLLAEDERSHAEFMSMVSAHLREKKTLFMLILRLTGKPETVLRSHSKDLRNIWREKVSPRDGW